MECYGNYSDNVLKRIAFLNTGNILKCKDELLRSNTTNICVATSVVRKFGTIVSRYDIICY